MPPSRSTKRLPSLSGVTFRHLAPGLLLIAALWVVLGAAIRWDAESERRTARRQTSAIVDVLDAHATRLLREAEQVARLVAWEVRKRGVALPLDTYVSAQVIRLDAFLQIAVIDRSGILRASTVPGFSPVDLSDREHFRVHLEADDAGLFIGKPVVGRASGKPSIQLSRRITDDHGKFLGVVVVSMDPSYLTRLYDELRVGKHGAIAVVGADDFVVRAHRSGPVDAVGMTLPPGSGLREAASAAPSGSFIARSVVDNVARISSFKRLSAYPLIVTVGFSEHEFMAAYRARRQFLLIAGALMSLLILSAAIHQARLYQRALVSAREERAAKEREAAKADRIDALFEAIPKPAMGLSPARTLDGLNQQLLALLDLGRDQIWGATPETIAQRFFRHDRSAHRAVKERELVEALSETAASPRHMVMRVESPTPTVYELQVEPRRGGGTVAMFRDITEQNDLSESERDLATTLYAISDAVISTDASGRIKRMNPTAELLTGWSAAEARGREAATVLRLHDADQRGAIADPARDVLASGQDVHLGGQHIYRADTREVVVVTVSAAPIRDDSGEVRGAVLVVRNVTSERQAEAALRSSERRYRTLLDLLPCALLVQQGGRLQYANQMAVSMLAAPTRDALLDRPAMSLIHPDYHDAVQQRLRRLRETGQPAPMMEQTWIALNGEPVHCEVTAAPYLWDGHPSALVLLQDIGARKLAELQRDRFFELSLDLQCVAGTDGYFKRVNPAFQQVLGWSEEELLAEPYLHFVHPDDREATSAETASRAPGVLTEHFENRYRCKNGEYRWLAWNAVREPDGRIYATARDVTENRAANADLMRAKADAESASRAKSAFLATMSHEIRTPMNGVVGMVEVLAQTELTDDQANIMATIRESANSLLRIIDDILDFSKIEAGRMEMECSPVSLRRLVTTLCASLLPMATKSGVLLTHAVAPSVPDSVLSDGVRLRQLLNNLVGNAIKFSARVPGRQGRVEMLTDVQPGEPPTLRFEVRDNGIGIEPAAMQHLFEPFTQAEVSTTRRFGGTGLGLAICRRIVELMGGEMTVQSEPGQGSTFTVTLPLVIAEAAPLAPLAPLAPRASRPPSIPLQEDAVPKESSMSPCILVAEDDSINQKVILRQLGLLGYRAEIAGDGAAALEQWRSGRYAMVLTDLHMPVMDGYELAQAIRNEEQGRRIPILALTANALQGEMKRTLAAGMDGYLTKPLHLEALRSELEKWLPTAQAQWGDGTQASADVDGALPAAVDPAALIALIGDSEEAVNELLSHFASILRRTVATMREHRERNEIGAIGDEAHKLKSSSRSVGAARLGDFCALLENASKAGTLPEVDTRLSEVEAESARVLECLDGMLSNGPAHKAADDGANV